MPQVRRVLHLVLIVAFLAVLGGLAWMFASSHEADERPLPTATNTDIAAEPETVKLLAYYPNARLGNYDQDCDDVFPVEREISDADGESIFPNLIAVLLAGPTAEEQSQGFSSPFAEDSVLLDERREGTILYLNFNAAFNKVAGSCRIESIRSAINSTLRQFSSVEGAVISIEGGNPDEALQP